MRCDKLFVRILPLLAGYSVSADVIAEYGPGVDLVGNGQAHGQAVTTPAGSSWADLRFSWFSTSDGSRLAEGSL